MSFPENFKSDGGQHDIVALTDAYSQADIPSGETILIDLSANFKSVEGKHDVVLTYAYSQADIPSGETILIELPRDFKSDGGQHDVVLKLKKSLYGQTKAARLWYEKL